MIYVKKHPSPSAQYVARCSIPSGENPAFWEHMTEQQLTEWITADLAAGWAPQSQEMPGAQIPTSCTRWQGKRWLLDHGYLPSQIEAMLTAIADPVTREAALIDWHDAETWQRDNVFVVQVSEQLGVNLDTFFREASEL